MPCLSAVQLKNVPKPSQWQKRGNAVWIPTFSFQLKMNYLQGSGGELGAKKTKIGLSAPKVRRRVLGSSYHNFQPRPDASKRSLSSDDDLQLWLTGYTCESTESPAGKKKRKRSIVRVHNPKPNYRSWQFVTVIRRWRGNATIILGKRWVKTPISENKHHMGLLAAIHSAIHSDLLLWEKKPKNFSRHKHFCERILWNIFQINPKWYF